MKFRNLMSIVAAVALVAAFAVSASAAQLSLSLVYTASVDAGFGAVPDDLVPAPGEQPGGVDPTHHHNFQVLMSLVDTTPTEDFQAVQFDIQMGPGFSPSDFGGFTQWTANAPEYDPNGLPPPPAAPIFSDNGDIGALPDDLQRIFVQTASSLLASSHPGEADQSEQLGGPAPLLLGDFWVQYDQSVDGSLDSGLTIAPNGLNPWGLWDGAEAFAQPASSFSGGSFEVSGGTPVIPEPASIVLFGLAMVGLVGLRRRS